MMTEVERTALELIADYRVGIVRRRKEEQSQVDRFDATLEEIQSEPAKRLVVLNDGKYLSGILRSGPVYSTQIERAKTFDAVTEQETARQFGITIPAPWHIS